jgi:hypothetical protein
MSSGAVCAFPDPALTLRGASPPPLPRRRWHVLLVLGLLAIGSLPAPPALFRQASPYGPPAPALPRHPIPPSNLPMPYSRPQSVYSAQSSPTLDSEGPTSAFNEDPMELARRFGVPAGRLADFLDHHRTQTQSLRRMEETVEGLRLRVAQYEMHIAEIAKEHAAMDGAREQELAVLKEHLCATTQRTFVERFFRELANYWAFPPRIQLRQVYGRVTYEVNRNRRAFLTRISLPDDFPWPYLRPYLLDGPVPNKPFLQYYKTVFVLSEDPETTRRFFRCLADRYGASYEEVDSAQLAKYNLGQL